jgi:hypothetical protein
LGKKIFVLWKKYPGNKMAMRLRHTSLVAAPTFLFAYGITRIVDGLDGSYGPGFAWTLGHIMFLLAFILFGFVITELGFRTRNGNSFRKFITWLAVILGMAGVLDFIRVAIIDIIVGFRARDHASMSAISHQLNSYPSTSLAPLYNVGPILFQLGLIIITLQLIVTKPRQLSWWSLGFLILGFLLLATNLGLLPLSAIFIGLAFSPLFAPTDRSG